MADIYEELENFFRAQKDLFGPDLMLDGDLNENSRGVESGKSATAAAETGGKGQSPLRQFYYEIKDCLNCPLGALRTNFVFGAGNDHAELMLVGEAPGRDEDLKGIPFVGRAGQLLTLMLNAIGLQREDVFIANVLKCRPPNNRDPLPEEIDQCEPYLLKQIDLIKPRLIVTLGRFAAASLLRSKTALGTLRGEVHTYNDVPLIVTYHPAALLRNPQLKKQAWEDLKKISGVLKNIDPTG